MNEIGFRRVQRRRAVSDILSRMEHSKGKAIEEFTLGQKATDRLQTPSCFRLQKLRNIFELRNGIRMVSFHIFTERNNALIKFFASMLGEHFDQFVEAEFPRVNFILLIINFFNGSIHFVV
jgi:hypothetical protein